MTAHDLGKNANLLLWLIALLGTGVVYQELAGASPRRRPANLFRPAPADPEPEPGRDEMYHEIIGQLVCRESSPLAAPRYFPRETRRDELYETFSQFYAGQGCRLAWFDLRGPLPRVDSLWEALRQAPHEGLTANYYRAELVAQVQRVFNRPRALEEIDTDWLTRLVTLDFRLTATYLRYASHLLAGQAAPEQSDPAWHPNPRKRDLAAVLGQALREDRIHSSLLGLRPARRQYEALKAALTRYRALAGRGGWPALPAGVTLRAGDVNRAAVPLLRQRLALTGDYTAGPVPTDEPVFDAALGEAVKRYQRRNGLPDDGVAGPNTIAMLNVPVEKRIGQLRVNLERLRWLPDAPDGRHVLVNVPEYRLRVKEGERSVLDMKVIVGKQYHSTPLFRDTITYLVFNPTWTVPPGIARREILPRIKRDPQYLARNGYRLYRSWTDNATRVPPGSVDWQAMTPRRFTWRLVKEPGRHNPLGSVKFMFPNPFQVYLHDTPNGRLFDRNKRAFSHGCVRLARPLDLAAYLLSDLPGWDRDSINRQVAPGGPATPVALPGPVPVQFIYRTAFVDEQGLVHFRRDVYRHDERQITALAQTP